MTQKVVTAKSAGRLKVYGLNILGLVLIFTFVRLGFWQWSRSEEKQLIVDQQAQRTALEPIQLHGQDLSEQEVDLRRATVTGVFESRYTIFIDNKTEQGRAGYQVVMPLRINHSAQYILVNRGWVPLGRSRLSLPEVTTPGDTVTVNGMLKTPGKETAWFVTGNRSNTGWPALFRWVDIDVIGAEINLPIYRYVLLQDPDDSHGFVRHWLLINSSPEKSMAYAWQWFSFAAILAGLMIYFNFKRAQANNDG